MRSLWTIMDRDKQGVSVLPNLVFGGDVLITLYVHVIVSLFSSCPAVEQYQLYISLRLESMAQIISTVYGADSRTNYLDGFLY
jgi:hypothetical protein